MRDSINLRLKMKEYFTKLLIKSNTSAVEDVNKPVELK
jgi:hypothetical protein